MEQRTSDRDAGATTGFDGDAVKLLLETVRTAAGQERDDIGTEGPLSALGGGDRACADRERRRCRRAAGRAGTADPTRSGAECLRPRRFAHAYDRV